MASTTFSKPIDDEIEALNSNITTVSGRVTTLETKGTRSAKSVAASSSNKLYNAAYFEKINGVVICHINGFDGLTNQSTNTAVTIPTGYVPAYSCDTMVYYQGESYKVMCNSSGTITVYPYSGKSNEHGVTATIAYITT